SISPTAAEALQNSLLPKTNQALRVFGGPFCCVQLRWPNSLDRPDFKNRKSFIFSLRKPKRYGNVT
ncbi:hypothetical protein, partial [Brevundimonas sp.]|uniref:hypothetical protein n=1 Tax=Brevundimonas sp. TaxID=1871086 RepID=UPI002FCA9467